MTKWIKPNGTEIETIDNDVTTEYVESLGWKRATSRGRPKGALNKPKAIDGATDEVETQASEE